MTIEEIKELKESEHKAELKEAKTGYTFAGTRKSILGYVSALANERGGMLVLGVKELKYGTNEIVGSNAFAGAEGKLEQDIYKAMYIRVSIEVIYDTAGKRVLIIHVPSRPVGKALKLDDVPLMRVGEDLLPMSDEQLFKILQEQEPDFSARICEGLTLNDLDQDAIEKMKEKYSIKQKNASFRSKVPEQVLSDLRLMSGGQLTYAALILLGKKEAIQRYLSHACVT